MKASSLCVLDYSILQKCYCDKSEFAAAAARLSVAH